MNPIRPTIPLDAPGKTHGFLRLPYSRNDSAWGNVMIPLTVIANGSGPTALLTGGNHGDEYEGELQLGRLMRRLEAAATTRRRRRVSHPRREDEHSVSRKRHSQRAIQLGAGHNDAD